MRRHYLTQNNLPTYQPTYIPAFVPPLKGIQKERSWGLVTFDFISFHFIHFISYSRYKKGHAHNQLYDLLGAILEEVDDICYSISKKNIMCFKGGEYNKMLKKIVTRKKRELEFGASC